MNQMRSRRRGRRPGVLGVASLLALTGFGSGTVLAESADLATTSLRLAPLLLAQADVQNDDVADLAALLDDEGASEPAGGGGAGAWHGFVEFGAAYTTPSPGHWSKARARLELGRTGRLGGGMKWKVSGRADVDFAYLDGRDVYHEAVRHNQRADLQIRETYLDLPAGDWDFRLGRQHIVWGEMVGLFFADVVSARDMREFLLPEFDQLRIPQWAVRAERFGDDWHGEVIWIPLPTVDRIGKPGADFYPFPLPPGASVGVEDQHPSGGNFGLRLSHQTGGWDLAGFAYTSRDVQPALERRALLPAPAFVPIHPRIHQFGATLSKDLGFGVLRAEGVYTRGRNFSVTTLADADGLVELDTADWAVGVDHTTVGGARFNAQLFQRAFLDHDRATGYDRYETGLSLLANTKFGRNWEAEALLVALTNRSDWMFRPRLVRMLTPNLRWQLGADLFGGASGVLFGRFDRSDRVYSELRLSF